MGVNVGENHFQVVPTNPNPNGRCLFAPLGQHSGCEGPYIQFNAVAASLVADESGPVRFGAVACVKCLREAIADADQAVNSGQVQPNQEDQRSMTERMAEQPKATMDFEDLPEEDRKRLISSLGPGETVRMPQGVVVIPGRKPTKERSNLQPTQAPSPSQIVGISGEALADDGEVPGHKRDTYERFEPEDDILAEVAEGR